MDQDWMEAADNERLGSRSATECGLWLHAKITTDSVPIKTPKLINLTNACARQKSLILMV